MILLLPEQVIKRLKRKLCRRKNEIGGVLVGEHVAADTFRIVDISVQQRGGAAAHFVRDPEHHKAFLTDFFAKTGNNYKRFNYIGEWHSHPAFEVFPSDSDLSTMDDLVKDPDVGANFAVLLIVRLKNCRTLELSATLFRAGMIPEAVSVEPDNLPNTAIRQSVLERLLDYFM
jgi:proteasome lid subunit RPN8/RPN11